MRSALVLSLLLAPTMASAQSADGSFEARLVAASEAALTAIEPPGGGARPSAIVGRPTEPERAVERALSRASLEDELLASATLTAVGALGVVTGAVLAFATYGCTEQLGAELGGRCGPDGGFLAAGLGSLAVSALMVTIGAAWLSVVDRRRLELDEALQASLSVTERGAVVGLRGRF